MKSGLNDFLLDRDIVIVTLSEWDGPRRIRHHLANEFARRGNRVLFVEGYYTISKFLRAPDFPKFFRFLEGPREFKKNLFLLSVFPFLPFGEFSSFISGINWSVARISITRALKRLGFKESVLLIFAYNGDTLVGRLGEKVSVYFCNDAFDKLHNVEFLRQRVRALERRLLEKTDGVITVSEKLTEERAPFAKRITTVHHGVDYQLFEESGTSSFIPADIKDIRTPVVGYSGVVRHIIDLNLLEYVAERKPEWSIAIVGPVTESDAQYYRRIEQLKKKENVHFLGSKSSDVIPQYIRQFAVCLLPYTLDELSTYYAAPLKFYEYLAAGKPVVSTVGPLTFDDSIVINARTEEDFVKGIDKAVSLTSPGDVARRKEIARLNGWDKRVEAISEFLSSLVQAAKERT